MDEVASETTGGAPSSWVTSAVNLHDAAVARDALNAAGVSATTVNAVENMVQTQGIGSTLDAFAAAVSKTNAAVRQVVASTGFSCGSEIGSYALNAALGNAPLLAADNSVGLGPNAASSTTYSGAISYKYGGVLYSYGTFDGVVASNTSPSQYYKVTGSLNGFGLQFGYFSGEASISFTTTHEQPTLASGRTTGFFAGSLGAGVGPLNIGSIDVTSGINNFSGYLSPRAELGGIASIFTSGGGKPSNALSTDTNALKPGDIAELKAGVGGSLSFQGVTFKTVVPIQSAPKEGEGGKP
jgi:hypothetical protein